MTNAAKTKKTASLGRIKSLGPEQLWQTALLLPQDWDDLTSPWESFGLLQAEPPGTTVLVKGQLLNQPRGRFEGTPRLSFVLHDPDGNKVGTTFFGDTRNIPLFVGQDHYLKGRVRHFDGLVWLDSPELIPAEWVGRLRPIYPGKARVIKPETVRENIVANLEQSAERAAEFLRESLAKEGNPQEIAEALKLPPQESFKAMIMAAHLPRTREVGVKAQQILERIAAFCRIREAKGDPRPARTTTFSVSVEQIRSITAALPFELDAEQKRAIWDLVCRLGDCDPMRHLISGDVGSGKTAVFACVAAAVAFNGGRVAVMAPTGPLAAQSLEKIQQWWPSLTCELVTGDTKTDDGQLQCAQVVAGSTALLHRDIGTFDLIVVDEQQKFSRNQREGLFKKGDEHLIEATATCIPRSMALLKYGDWSVSRLRGAHVTKNIQTQIRDRLEAPKRVREQLMEAIKETIRNDGQVLMVYPTREGGLDKQGDDDNAKAKRLRQSVAGATELFESLFPGRVADVDGSCTDEQKAEAIRRMRDDEADVLVATSLVEVGIDLPRLRRCVVVHPERLGLTMLHQIRGRVARAGGQGYFDLYVMDEISPKSRERIEALTQTDDGFELTEMDMRLRGVGDMSAESKRQSGADETFLYGRPLSFEALESVSQILDR